jgi:8-oxo-dGTP pyrophosphatase MutT (NUDIX family)
LRREYAERLQAWPHIFSRNAQVVAIAESLRTPAKRTQAIDAVVYALHAEGTISGWRDERYVVSTAFDAKPLFNIERAAARFFGTTTYAAHANGYCGSEMWIARRSDNKPIDPGMLDNLVGGGMSAGVAPLDTIVREASEEAGIEAAISSNAVPRGTIELLREVKEGVQSEIIFVFDLELPPDFTPKNQDGEVAGFIRIPLEEVASLIGAKRMTLDASLVAAGFLERELVK